MQHLKFVNYRAEEISFEVNKNLTTGEKNFKINPNIRVDIRTEGSAYFTVITVTILSKDEAPTPFNIVVKVNAQFMIVSPGSINTLRSESTNFIYPYVRTIVSSLITQANMPPYFLPLIDFTLPNTDGDEQGGEKKDTITIRPLTDEV